MVIIYFWSIVGVSVCFVHGMWCSIAIPSSVVFGSCVAVASGGVRRC